MIIQFSVENWRSFRDEATLSMVASKVRAHAERVPFVKKLGLKILPVTAIFGANGAGKTKLVEALRFAQSFVVDGVSTDAKIAVQPFKLDRVSKDKPCTFSFDLLIDENVYSYRFSLSSEAVLFETLEFSNSTSKYEIFTRKNGNIHYGDKLKDQVDKNILNVIRDGTRANALFLSNAVGQRIKAKILQDLFDWFAHKLIIISPNSVFIQIHRFIDKKDELSSDLNDRLQQLDLGIHHLAGKPSEYGRDLSAEELQNLRNQLVKSHSALRIGGDAVVTPQGESLVKHRIVAMHETADGQMVEFALQDESEGTNRLLNLFPLFLMLERQRSEYVFVIDELERSIHSSLICGLVKHYLEKNSTESRSQLIFTTHNLEFFDQKFMRRDELWITNKESDGSTKLYSVEEFKTIRKDKDIQKSYLRGYFGGVPNILGSVNGASWGEPQTLSTFGPKLREEP